MITYKQIKYILISIILIQMMACSTSYQSVVSNRNVSSIYDVNSAGAIATTQITHLSDTSSKLYVKLNLDDFLFKLNEETNNYEANILIHYNIYESYESSSILDSATTELQIIQDNKQAEEIEFQVKTENFKRTILELRVKDKNRKKTFVDYLKVDKSKRLNFQDCSFVNEKSNKRLQNQYINSDNNYKLVCNRAKPEKLFISYLKPIFRMPKPPFAATANKENLQADSTWVVEYKDSLSLDFQKTGTYYLSKDTFLKNGFCLYRFYNDFPNLFRPEQMLLPIRYLTTNKEFKDLTMYADKKVAVDNYWLGLGGNINRTKQLIKSFYSRVQLANKHFSTYKQGWLTDRGMIYTVLGKPSYVYRTNKYEKWIYGSDVGYSTLTYIFMKEENKFTNNDYKLVRTELYKSVWYQAIETWRKGLEYSIGK